VYKINFQFKNIFGFLKPSILEGNKELKIIDIIDEHGGENKIIIPSCIAFEFRLLIDFLLYINLFLITLAFIYPKMFIHVEFIKEGITYAYPGAFLLANWSIFCFFIVIIPGKYIKSLLKKKNI